MCRCIVLAALLSSGCLFVDEGAGLEDIGLPIPDFTRHCTRVIFCGEGENEVPNLVWEDHVCMTSDERRSENSAWASDCGRREFCEKNFGSPEGRCRWDCERTNEPCFR